MCESLPFRIPLRKVSLVPASGDGPRSSDQPDPDEPDAPAKPVGNGKAAIQALIDAAVERGREEERQRLESAMAAERSAMRKLQEDLFSRLSSAHQELADQVEAALPELIIEGVQRVLSTWKPSMEDVQEAVSHLLEEHGEHHERMRLWVSPTDHQILQEIHPSLESTYSQLVVLSDSSMSSGEYVLESRFGRTDARFATKVKNLRKALT